MAGEGPGLSPARSEVRDERLRPDVLAKLHETAQPAVDGHPPAAFSPDTALALSAADGVIDAQTRMILDLSRLLAVPTDLDTMLCQLAETCTRLIGCDRASIFLYDSG